VWFFRRREVVTKPPLDWARVRGGRAPSRDAPTADDRRHDAFNDVLRGAPAREREFGENDDENVRSRDGLHHKFETTFALRERIGAASRDAARGAVDAARDDRGARVVCGGHELGGVGAVVVDKVCVEGRGGGAARGERERRVDCEFLDSSPRCGGSASVGVIVYFS